MTAILWLIPVALLLGLLGLGQYEDLDGAAERILLDDDRPLPARKTKRAGARDD
jgi:cbb3-type cytochrome oxidase maturation protein